MSGYDLYYIGCKYVTRRVHLAVWLMMYAMNQFNMFQMAIDHDSPETSIQI